jgi:hypothetical protein
LVGYSAYSSTIDVLAAQIPDVPTSLANVASNTFANQISLEWVAPVFEGGSPVLDYTIWYDNASNGATFTELVSGFTTLDHTATGLTQGSTYKFRVNARNAYGYSADSNTVTILAA